MDQKVKLFLKKEWIKNEKPIHFILYPLLPNALRENNNYAPYLSNLKAFEDNFELTESINDADYAFWPHNFSYEQDYAQVSFLAKELENSKIKLLVFFLDDCDKPLSIPNTVIYRTSLDKSRQLPNEFIMPAFISDCEDEFGPISYREYTGNKPVIGFCGNVNNHANCRNPIKRFFKVLGYDYILAKPRINKIAEILGIHITKHKGRKLRTQLLSILKKSSLIETNFLIRDFFQNGLCRGDIVNQAEKHKSTQSDFYKNVSTSDYTLAPRGGGNFSYRFSETLCFGRIPLFINADSPLPFDDEINWKDLCIWVEERDILHAPEIIAKYHQNLSPEAFLEKQQACRKIWEDYLSIPGFFKHMKAKLLSQHNT